ncbi:MAG: APC family permease [Deltaproteobacteria bacterium]
MVMRRSLSRFDITCLGLNAIVGSGIFALPDDLYRELGWLSPLAFVCCLVGLLPVAWCYAAAAAECDRTGGPYIYASEAFGPRVGFGVGWMCFANSVFSFAAVACIAAANAARLVPALDPPAVQKLVAVGIVAVFAALNYRGARPGAIAVDVFTAGKFLVLLLVVSVLVPQVSPSHFSGDLPSGVGNLGRATFIALFAAQGFEVVPVPAGETRMPKRDVPFAVVSSLVGASLLYILVQTVLVGSGAALAAPTDTPLADAARRVAPGLGFVIAVGGLISTLGFVSGSALGTPRYLYAAAVGGQLPKRLAETHPRFGSPHFAVVATAVLAVICLLPFDYRSLIGMSNVAVAVQYLVTCLAVFKFRRGKPQGVKAALPWIGAAASVWIVTEANTEELIWAGASLAVGAVLVTLTSYLARSRPGHSTP